MIYKFLTLDTEEDEIYYLGYKLMLTESERAILGMLAKNPGKYFTREEIADNSTAEVRIKAGSVSVHISSVNAKAGKIGSRPLIECKRGVGYKISDNM